MGRTDRYSRRTRPTRQPRDVILIVCGGKTEKIYFERFNIALGRVRVRLMLDATSPSRIVDRAIFEKNQGDYARVWCVFDRDEFNDFDQAIEVGRSHGIRVASSNQAFELWFLQHFGNYGAPLHRSHYGQELARLLGRPYSKTDKRLYDSLKDKTLVAVVNAKAGFQRHKLIQSRPSQSESYTTVFALVEELLQWGPRA